MHQSGINNIAIQSTCVGTGTEPISRHVLISVGDDNALRAVFINVSSASQDSGISVEVVTEHVYTTAHASAITGMALYIHMQCPNDLYCYRCVLY